FLVEGPDWLQRYWQLHPKARRQHDKVLAERMYRVVTGYVNGQVLIAAIASVFAMTTLVIASHVIGVSVNAVALAGIVFLFGLIPLIGNTLAASVVILVSLFSSVPLAVTMLVYFLIYQQVENVTLQPYIQSRHNVLTPLLVFVAALIGAGLGGILGAFVAIPAVGCLRILLTDYLKNRGIGKA
ncbi:AI-2E family transporter, partial [Candidatus Saccharibacteria bacterium]|nr:AI-2E family transporter [Candidatus Saccharibacteria bacterium]